MKYIIAFVVVMIVSSAIVNYQFPPAKMPVGIAGVVDSEMGVWKRREGLIPEIKIVDGNRLIRYASKVSNKHENREAELPGNN
jgi:hypothetical protein